MKWMQVVTNILFQNKLTVDLINMHQARGDQIYFITGRTAGDKDGVTPVLQKAFNIKDMHPVEFMGGRKLPTKI